MTRSGGGWRMLTKDFLPWQSELGITMSVLMDWLQGLIELGIWERYPLETRAKTDGCQLTRKGAELYPVLVALRLWGTGQSVPGLATGGLCGCRARLLETRTPRGPIWWPDLDRLHWPSGGGRAPSMPMLGGLAMELVATPLMFLWHLRLGRGMMP